MDINTLSHSLSASPQIGTADLAAIKAAGFKAIICNRPDGEATGQPGFADIARAADAAGLLARYVPVTPGQITDTDVADFGAALAALPHPVLAYCRSGARSAALWSRHIAAVDSVP